MAPALRVSTSATSSVSSPESTSATAVGASYVFDPGREGLAGIYATRILDRGGDPRAVCAEVRADRLGLPERGAISRALMERERTSRFGRGTAAHLHAVTARPRQAPAPPVVKTRLTPERSTGMATPRWSRRLAAAGLALLLLLPLGVLAANAEEAPHQARYIVQPGDTLHGVATEFGVDPEAILAASAIQNAPYLTPEEVIIIPDPAASPEHAASTAMMFQGTSPFVAGAHEVAAGETIGNISWHYGLDPWALAAFNGVSDIDSLDVGQKLRIPLTDQVDPMSTWDPDAAAATDWESAAVPDAVGGTTDTWEAPASAPVFTVEPPAYKQAYSLSCEYAAAYIATAAFGYGVPESAFIERIGLSENPHWGYRGDITGAWGGTDDYGIYAEPLVPTLNEFGYSAEVFYGGAAESLTARLDAGIPVIAWLGYFGDTGWQQYDAGSYLLAPGMHAVTVYGYDDWGVYFVNPGNGAYEYTTWDDFLAKWAVIDGMGLAVAPM